jgi:hypothetical protein
MRIGERLSGGNDLIAGIVGGSLVRTGVRQLEQMVATGKMADAELQEVVNGIEATKRRLPDLAQAFKRDRAVIMMTVPLVQKYGAEAIEFARLRSFLEGEGPFEWRKGFDAEAAKKNLNEVFDFYEDQARKPAYVALAPGNRFSDFRKKHEAKWDQMTELVAPVYESVLHNCVELQVRVDLLTLRAALERYKLANKSYPRTLDQLALAILPALPDDPYSGKHYGYRLTDHGDFVVWSVGDDLKDDGGKFPVDIIVTSEENQIGGPP